MEEESSIEAAVASSLGAEERYRTLFNAIDEGFCVIEMLFDEDGRAIDYRFVETNPAFERQTGLKNPEGKRVRDLVPLHEEHWYQTFGKVARTLKPVRFVNHSASLGRWFDVYAFPIGDPKAHLVAVLFNDITERRRADDSLREREEQLRLIIESATEYAIMVSDAGRRITGWNTGAERLVGYTEEEILGKSADILFTPEDRATGQPQKEIRTALEMGRAVNERWHMRKDGTRFWGSGFMFRLNSTGRAAGFLKIMRDRTAERQAEQDLRQSAVRLRLAVESAELGTWEFNSETSAVTMDERTRTALGIPAGKEPTYELILGAIHPDDRERARATIARAIKREEGDSYRDEYRVNRLDDGTQRWVRAAARVHFDAEGRTTHVVGTVLDISDLMAAREVLARRSEELERTVEDRTKQLREMVDQLETFSYSVVHDLRAPLRSVRSFAGILAEEYGPNLDDRARGYLRRLQNSVTRMDSLITDVLTYSRVNATEAELMPVNIDQLVHEIVEQYPQFQEWRSSMHVEGKLPMVLGNRALLTQCISNLLGNALKFVHPDRKPQVVIRADTNGDRVRIWFEDNGIGIAPGFRDRIFGLFERLHGPDQFPGTGVGLAIVQKAVKRMRGDVGVESEPGRGSRFWIELGVPQRNRETTPAA